MKECTCVNKVYGTLKKYNVHTVLHAAEKNSVYSVHSESSFYTLLFSMIFLLLYSQKVYLFSMITVKCILSSRILDRCNDTCSMSIVHTAYTSCLEII